jgi:NADPH:quinone reductase-like Zn-dependent oxidoreductase
MSTAITASAITYSRYGGPDVLTLGTVDVLQPGPGQVRIRVRAVAINLIDVKIRSGRMDGIFPVRFPVLPGWDVAGVVDAVGEGALIEGVTAAVGDEVFGVASVGGYSEYAVLDRPAAKPRSLSWEAAASVITVGEAAFRVLKHLGLKAGQTLLVLGAGGSVGTIAVQLAAARGITVIGTAAEGDLERLTEFGATAVRYGDGWADRVRAVLPGGPAAPAGMAAPAVVDAVFDAAGAGLLADAIDLAGGADHVITIADDNFADHGVRFTGADPADRAPEALPELAALMAAGKLAVPVWRSYPLAQAAQAHADIEARRNHGKIILLP